MIAVLLAVSSVAARPTLVLPTNAESPATTVDAAPSETISDGQSITAQGSVLTDSVSGSAGTGGVRYYTIILHASVAMPGFLVEVQTFPIAQWALPDQLPGGPDNLPALSLWNWSVEENGNPLPAWTESLTGQMLSGPTSWTNQTIDVYGLTAPSVTVRVSATTDDGTTTPGTGFVLNTPGVTGGIPSNESDLEGDAAALHPQIVRLGTVLANTVPSWQSSTDQPIYSFGIFDRIASFTSATGAQLFLGLPAGSWGDGNVLPSGMPVNSTVEVVSSTGDGFFPQDAAWVAYVEGIVNHTIAAHEAVGYWSIGNEFTDTNQSLVAEYTHIFNLAAQVIHAQLPSARVGSDAMLNTTYEAYFASHAREVGFLSFHYYPALGICVVNGTYCPPSATSNGTTDGSLFSHPSYSYLPGQYTPLAAQSLWHNLTGTWVPMLDSETNLNPTAGNPSSAGIGTDPRIQTLFGAAWVSVVLVDGAFQNVSDLVYYSLSSGWGRPAGLTEPYGGWGFGLTSEAPNDTTIRYAPYLALELWGSSMPAGQPGLLTNSSAPGIVEPYAARDGPVVSMFLVNRVNVPVAITPVLTSGGYTLTCVSTLDQRSYREVYSPADGSTTLETAGINDSQPAAGQPFTIDGYGVALVRYVLDGSGAAACPALGPPVPLPLTGLGPTVVVASVALGFSVSLGATWLVFPSGLGIRSRHRRAPGRETDRTPGGPGPSREAESDSPEASEPPAFEAPGTVSTEPLDLRPSEDVD